MSIFRTYTPKLLYQMTLQMIDTMFVNPPTLEIDPASYFTATLNAHKWIVNDLTQSLPQAPTSSTPAATIDQIHISLSEIEQLLFGTRSEFDVSLEGCCLYTHHLRQKLKPTHSCVLH